MKKVCCGVAMAATVGLAGMSGDGASEEKVHTAPPVVVTAKAREVLERTTAETPSLEVSRTVVTAEEIKLQNATTLTEAMEYAPGMLTETRGRKVKQFTSFRGQKYPYPEYAIDGIWQREFHELPYFYPASVIDRIEVIRSGSGLLLGMSSLAGVINIVPKHFETPTTMLEGEYGTFNTIRGYALHAQPFDDGGYLVSLGHYHTDGPDGRRGSEDMTSLMGSLDWQPADELELEANLHLLYGKRQLVRALPPAAGRLQRTDEEYDPYRAAMLTLRGIYHESETATTELMLYSTLRSHDFQSTTPGVHAVNDEDDYEFGVHLMQALALSDWNMLRVGALYNYWVAPHGKRFYEGRRNALHTVSAVAVDECDWGEVKIDGGIRYTQTYLDEYAAFNIDGSSSGFGNVEPLRDEWDEPVVTASGGAVWECLPGVSLFAHLAGGRLEPRSGTVNADMAEPATESRLMVDCGVKLESESYGAASVAAFYIDRGDAIILLGDTATNAVGREFELYGNEDRRQAGFEVELRSAKVADCVTMFANGSYMDLEAKRGGDWVENRELPDTTISAGAYVAVGSFDCTLLAKRVSRFESNRFAGDGQFHALGDYVAGDIVVGYTFGEDDATRVYGAVDNVSDEAFATVVGYPDYGRRYSVGVQHTF